MGASWGAAKEGTLTMSPHVEPGPLVGSYRGLSRPKRPQLAASPLSCLSPSLAPASLTVAVFPSQLIVDAPAASCRLFGGATPGPG